MTSCLNGHAVESGDAYCSRCGATVTPTTSDVVEGWYPDAQVAGGLRYWDGQQWTDQRMEAAAPKAQAQSGASLVSLASKLGSRMGGLLVWCRSNRAAAVGVGVALVIIASLGVIGMTDSDDEYDPSVSAVSQSQQRDDPHDVCFRQLMAVVTNMVDNNAYRGEMTVNGAEDPYWKIGVEIATSLSGERYRLGLRTAVENAERSAGVACTTKIGDRVRPDYPTDGSYPSLGSDPPPQQCPPGTTYGNFNGQGLGCYYN